MTTLVYNGVIQHFECVKLAGISSTVIRVHISYSRGKGSTNITLWSSNKSSTRRANCRAISQHAYKSPGDKLLLSTTLGMISTDQAMVQKKAGILIGLISST